ncbi:MAG TPA: hypothetical protein VGZ47_10190, partial [Gemmataceae bacterium]|nr:hypothetical protein [Gemmataceae bacterium]
VRGSEGRRMLRLFVGALLSLMFTTASRAQLPPANDDLSILRDIDVPPICKVAKPMPKEYQPDQISNEEVRKKPDKYPLRSAVLAAVDLVRKQAQEPTPAIEFAVPLPKDRPALMKRIAESQKPLARQMAELKEAQERLEGVEDHRKREPSKRWQAHYDYILSHVQLRYAYIFELSLMLGEFRKDNLPELDAKKNQNGWRLVPSEKMSSPAEVKDTVKSAHKLLNKVVKDHPDTPWATLANRDLNSPIGLQWEAAVIPIAAKK